MAPTVAADASAIPSARVNSAPLGSPLRGLLAGVVPPLEPLGRSLDLLSGQVAQGLVGRRLQPRELVLRGRVALPALRVRGAVHAAVDLDDLVEDVLLR